MPTEAVVLVTGASAGIGGAIAALCARSGYRVFGTSRKPAGVAGRDGVEMVALDVRDDDSVRACVDAVLANAGRIDVLINNAGYVLEGAVEEVTIEEAKAQFETNFFGVMRMVKAVAPAMRERHSGAIVNVSSVAGRVALPPFCGMYSASKYALESYTEHLWRELKPFGVRVCLVEPGNINTDLTGNRQGPSRPIEAYAGWRRRALDALRRREKAGPDPGAVARVVLSALCAARPKLRYTVGTDAAWTPRLDRVLPRDFVDRQLRRVFDLGDMG